MLQAFCRHLHCQQNKIYNPYFNIIMKKVLILSSSPRRGGNSDTLCDAFMEGAIANGNEVIEKTLLSHAAELQEKVFVVGSDLLEEFQVLSDDESVSTEQLEQFLKEKGIDENTIQQFLLELSQ